jgi:NAD-dependent dihydropyrimidine dehydrogenase PreA subunit
MQVTVVISRSGGDLRSAFEDALAALCSGCSGLDVILTPHLYHIPDDSGLWAQLSSLSGRVVLVSPLHPRPAEWLPKKHNVNCEFVLGFGEYPTPEACHAAITDALKLSTNSDQPAGTVVEMEEDAAERWYPVIDISRCKNCRNCLQFCLFGVYEVDAEGGVIVRNPDSCKPGCPACSRICPEGAIMFPLYAQDERIAGAPGMFMSPDISARKMFYTRTKRPCPVCGNAGDQPSNGTGRVCDECGRPVQETVQRPGPDARDDIDALIDDLDDLTRRSP